MVQLMESENLQEENKAVAQQQQPERPVIVEDLLEEEHGPLSKRSKTSSQAIQQQEWGAGASDAFLLAAGESNPLDEPSPLGLRLNKSPSLVDLIQKTINHRRTEESFSMAPGMPQGEKESKGAAAAATPVKFKASNFPATSLRIGSWEYISRYDGDLVVKCHFLRQKLVWEFLESGLKRKIEFLWSDIIALNMVNCLDYDNDVAHGTLIVMLAKPPHFSKEIEPQPRKHTVWHISTDFTNGQATIHRQHFLRCPQALLNKHFQKLILCDSRLNSLSRQPLEKIMRWPYFPDETPSLVSEVPDEPDLNQVLTSGCSFFSSFQDHGVASPYASHSSSAVTLSEQIPPGGAPSPISSGGNGEAVDSVVTGNLNQNTVPGLVKRDENVLEYLSSDQKNLIPRTNSLGCLSQNGPAPDQNMKGYGESGADGFGSVKDASGSEQAPGISRRDSLGELLDSLPEVAAFLDYLV